MVYKLEADDGTVYEIANLNEITNKFNNNEINKTQIPGVILQKIKDFCDIYTSLNKKERKLFDNALEFWNGTDELSNRIVESVNLNPELLIEMVKITHNYNIQPLTNLLCCAIARILKMHNYSDIVELFKVTG